MNNINRGVLIGIRMTLERISDLLGDIAHYESLKEEVADGGAPIIPHSEHLDSAIVHIDWAIDEIAQAVPEKADFEKWFEELQD